MCCAQRKEAKERKAAEARLLRTMHADAVRQAADLAGSTRPTDDGRMAQLSLIRKILALLDGAGSDATTLGDDTVTKLLKERMTGWEVGKYVNPMSNPAPLPYSNHDAKINALRC